MRRDPHALAIKDCKACMKSATTLQRQSLGCGYLPPPPAELKVRTWIPSGLIWSDDPKGPKQPTTCAGYTTHLPEVIEAARARYWKESLTVFTQGAQPTEQLMLAIEILDGAYGELERWASTPEDEGGGLKRGR